MKHPNISSARPEWRRRWANAGKVGIALGLIGGLGAAASQAASAAPSGGVLYVNAKTGSLARALSMAKPGSTIKLAPGTYTEPLTIDESLTIVGSGTSGAKATIIEPTTVTPSETDTDSYTPQAAIVYVAPGVTAALKNLTVNGSKASGSFTAGSTDYVGIYFRDARGSLTNVRVTGVEQPTAFGDQPGANGGVYVATDSSTTPPASGNGGTPVAWVPPTTAGPWSSSVTMRGVTVSNYDKNGITCDDVHTTCTITKSLVRGLGPIPTNAKPWENNAQNGIQIWGASATVSHTFVSGNSYTSPDYGSKAGNYYTTAAGILVINAGKLTLSGNTVTHNNADIYALWNRAFGLAPAKQGQWSITGNIASDAVNNTGSAGGLKVAFGDGFGDGIDLDGAHNVMVFDNLAKWDAEYGIALFDSYRSLLWDNTTSHEAGDGIYVGDDAYSSSSNSGIAVNVGGSRGNVIVANKASYNGLDGIFADTTSQDRANTFAYNALVNNARYGAEDVSKGPRTAGTDNFWHANACKPAHDSNVPGLC